MDWLAGLKTAIDYMEEHLLENISAEDVADAVYLSPFYFQRCFKMVTGYSIGEYLRNRRLYLAALELLNRNVPGEETRGKGSGGIRGEASDKGSSGIRGEASDKGSGGIRREASDKGSGGIRREACSKGRIGDSRVRGLVTDLAYKYGYDTPESFTRAFTRFHGLSPMQLKSQPHQIKVFLPLIVEISVKGGSRMDFVIEKREAMRMIGFERIFSYETSYREIPKFWDEFCGKYCRQDGPREQTADEDYDQEEAVRQTIAECVVGEFGVCVEDVGDMEHFRYYIAGAYQGGQVPEGMKVFEIPASEWAKFKCTGAMPDALQTVNTRIFKEWLPGNREYEMAFHLNIEWYSGGDTDSGAYESAIWIPVKCVKNF